MAVSMLQPIPVVMLTEPLATVVAYGGKCMPGRLALRQPSGAVLATRLRIPLGGTPLCHLYTKSRESPSLVLEGVLLGNVARSLDEARAEGCLLRWSWAYAPDGAAALRDQLDELIAYPFGRPSEDEIVASGGAAIFSFEGRLHVELASVIDRLRSRPLPDANGAIRSQSEPTDDPSEVADAYSDVRANLRVRVDVPCVFHTKRTSAFGRQARIYNIGRGGLFLATAEGLPEEGDRIRIRLTIELRDQPIPVEIVGRVRWPSPPGPGSPLAGFGVAIQRIADGARGQVFRKYLTGLLREHLEPGVSPERAAFIRPRSGPVYEVASRTRETTPPSPGSDGRAPARFSRVVPSSAEC